MDKETAETLNNRAHEFRERLEKIHSHSENGYRIYRREHVNDLFDEVEKLLRDKKLRLTTEQQQSFMTVVTSSLRSERAHPVARKYLKPRDKSVDDRPDYKINYHNTNNNLVMFDYSNFF